MSTDPNALMAAAPSAEVLIVGTRERAEVTLRNSCEALAKLDYLDRFEVAVQSRVQSGIKDDNDLRLTDELLVNVVRGGDAVEALCRPVISAAHTLHKSLVGESQKWISQNSKTKSWEGRWGVLRERLTSLILQYRRDKQALEERQQRELERAAEMERRRLEAVAKAAMREGNVETAKAALEEAQAVVTPMVASATPILDHASTRAPWQVEVISLEALVKAIADGIVPLSAVKEIDLTFLKKEVTKRGGLPANWAGLRAWQEDKLSVSRR